MSERTAYWGTCGECETSIVVYPHPDRGDDLPENANGNWKDGEMYSNCYVCGGGVEWGGSDPAHHIILNYPVRATPMSETPEYIIIEGEGYLSTWGHLYRRVKWPTKNRTGRESDKYVYRKYASGSMGNIRDLAVKLNSTGIYVPNRKQTNE